MSTDPSTDLPENHLELDKDGRVISFINNRTSHYLVHTDPRPYTQEEACDRVNTTLNHLAHASSLLRDWYPTAPSEAEAKTRPAHGFNNCTVPLELLTRSEYGDWWNCTLWNEPKPERYINISFTLGQISLGGTATASTLSLIMDRRLAETLDETAFTHAVVDALDPTEIGVIRAGDPDRHTLYTRP